MEQRTIRLRAFCSAKGGVGKSTLAVVCARLLAEQGKPTVLLDCDMSGTSLGDGLSLRAPKVKLLSDSITMDLSAPFSQEYHSEDETIHLRDKRKDLDWDKQPPLLPYFNDALLYESSDANSDCCMQALLWRHSAAHDTVLYFPSSSLPQDVSVALGWLYRDKLSQWKQRLAWILQAMIEQVPGLSNIVLDLPPGLFGFTREVLSLLAHLANGVSLGANFPDFLAISTNWRIKPFLVMTSDVNDLVAAMEAYMSLVGDLTTLVPLLNRSSEGIDASKRRLRKRFERFGSLGVEARLRSIGELRTTLGRVFLDGGLRVTEEVRVLQKLFLEDELHG